MTMMVLTFCHYCRGKMRRPKMCCTLINASACEWCCKLYCDSCVEKWYVRQSRFRTLTLD